MTTTTIDTITPPATGSAHPAARFADTLRSEWTKAARYRRPCGHCSPRLSSALASER